MSDEKKTDVQEEVVDQTTAATETAAAEKSAEAPAKKKRIPTKEEETAPQEEAKKVNPNRPVEQERTAHDDYDWTIGNRHTLNYTEKEIEDYLKDYEQSLTSLNESEIVEGKVTYIGNGDVVLDINFKSDGLVAHSEFRDMPDLAKGDVVKVYVESKEDSRGQLVLSRRKAKLLEAWESLVDSYKNGTILKGTVVSKTKGGLIVDCGGLETFLPGSQIDIKPIIDYDQYVGKTMEFKVVKINETIKNAVVSHKALIESDLAEQRETIIGGLDKGQVLEGIVKNITDFGAFMDLGGVDGLLYITDISWGRINHPTEVLELNQKLNVVVLDFDEHKKRISLGLKQLQPHPWDVLEADVKEGSIVKGKIVNIEDYGAFLEIIPGVEGLIHVSEVTWSNQPINAREFFSLAQEFDAKVVTIDREERKMSLSIKQMEEDPWGKVADKFPSGSKHTGEVKNLTPYGVFVELEEGIGGMIHVSDLSWTKRYSHPSEYTKVGENIDIQILEVDMDNRKLALGHKQLEENPWDTFENVFPIGSHHEATVIRKDDKGAIVQLPYGLEAFSPAKHLKKEDGSSANVDETLTFKVIEFNRDDKRILVSHLRFHDDLKRDAQDTVRKEKNTERRNTRSQIQKQNSGQKSTTLGEMDVFSQLKEQLKESNAAPAPEVKVEPVVEAPKAEEKKEEAPVAEAPAKEVAKDDGKPDDLKKIEGVGPKISELLAGGGLDTFQKVSEATPDAIREILLTGGSRYKMHDPTTWPDQAKLAAEGKWDELKEWQDKLDGGK